MRLIFLMALLCIGAASLFAEAGTERLSPSGSDLAMGNGPFELKVIITGIEAKGGYLMLAVYNQAEKFLSQERYESVRVETDGNAVMEVVFQLPKGTYALAVFQDVNRNGVLDRNFVRYPTEPFGFSNNVRPVNRPPNWQEARFDVYTDMEMKVRLK